MKPSNWKIACIMTIAVLAVSTSAIWVRLAMNIAGEYSIGFSLVLATSRLTLAALIVLPGGNEMREIEISSKKFQYAVVAGVCLAIHFASWISSLAFTSIVASTTLVTTNPIWIAILSRFCFGEKLSKLTTVGIGVAFLGGVLTASGNGEISTGSNVLLGNCLALFGALTVSLYMMCGTQAQKLGLSVGNYIRVAYAVAALILVVFSLLIRASYTGYPFLVYVCIVLMAIFPQLIGHTGLNWSLRWISPTFVSLSILCEPIISSVLGILVFGEIPPLSILWGGIVSIGGVAIAVLGNNDG